MVQAADLRNRDEVAFSQSLFPPGRGGVLLEGEVSAGSVIVEQVVGQHPAQMPLPKDDHLVQPRRHQKKHLQHGAILWPAASQSNRNSAG